MGNAGSAARRYLKGCIGEWGYRQLRELKGQICDRRVARLLAETTSTAFPPHFVAALDAIPQPSDIVDHIGPLFFYLVLANARFVVELGTRGGESTRALLAAVMITNGRVLSIDINDCSQIHLPDEMKKCW